MNTKTLITAAALAVCITTAQAQTEPQVPQPRDVNSMPVCQEAKSLTPELPSPSHYNARVVRQMERFRYENRIRRQELRLRCNELKRIEAERYQAALREYEEQRRIWEAKREAKREEAKRKEEEQRRQKREEERRAAEAAKRDNLGTLIGTLIGVNTRIYACKGLDETRRIKRIISQAKFNHDYWQTDVDDFLETTSRIKGKEFCTILKAGDVLEIIKVLPADWPRPTYYCVAYAGGGFDLSDPARPPLSKEEITKAREAWCYWVQGREP